MLYVQQVLQIPTGRASLLFPALNVAVIAGSLVGPRLLRRLGARRMLLTGFRHSRWNCLVACGGYHIGFVGTAAIALMGALASLLVPRQARALKGPHRSEISSEQTVPAHRIRDYLLTRRGSSDPGTLRMERVGPSQAHNSNNRSMCRALRQIDPPRYRPKAGSR